MRAILVIGILLAIAGCTLGRATCYEDQLETEWNSYKMKFGKYYSQAEDPVRKSIFLYNKKIIEAHNERWALGAESYKMGLNQFSDMWPEEITNAIGANVDMDFDDDVEMEHYDDVELELYDDWIVDEDMDFELPAKVNWTKMGAVSPVAYEGHFNNSWAFAAAGVMESHQFLKSGKLQVLSKQNLIDCCDVHRDQLSQALVCTKKKGGIDLEASYPYRGLTGKCRFNRKSIGARVNKIFKIRPGNEKRLAYVVSQGPVAATISHQALTHYRSGVYHNSHCGQKPDYAVLIVGYGHCKHHGDYWIIKTSLGTHWGEKGYMRLARNQHNLCGITNNAYYTQMK